MQVTNSTLDTQFVADLVAESFGIGSINQCEFLALGVNDTYLVESDTSKAVARMLAGARGDTL